MLHWLWELCLFALKSFYTVIQCSLGMVFLTCVHLSYSHIATLRHLRIHMIHPLNPHSWGPLLLPYIPWFSLHDWQEYPKPAVQLKRSWDGNGNINEYRYQNLNAASYRNIEIDTCTDCTHNIRCLYVCLFVCLSVCLFVCLSVCLFVCLFVCLSVQKVVDIPVYMYTLKFCGPCQCRL